MLEWKTASFTWKSGNWQRKFHNIASKFFDNGKWLDLANKNPSVTDSKVGK